MTLPASGTLVLGLTGGGNSINGEFGYGNDLGAYRGVYFGRGGLLLQFPTPPNLIGMDLFYSSFKITPGSQTFNSTQSFVIPVYNTITITVQAGGGGNGGNAGYNGCISAATPGSSGGSGGNSSFFTVGAGGGAGGPGTNGTGQPGQLVTQTFTNPVQGGTGPVSGSTATAIVGGGGGGGAGGPNAFLSGGNCFPSGNAPPGAAGAAGYITVTWA